MNEIEKRTVSKMITIYCDLKHSSRKELCRDCAQIEIYAHTRLEYCRFGEAKPNCKDCPIHCYKKDMRLQMQTIMRFSGPRMIFKHPVLAIRHLYKSQIKKQKVV